MKTAAGFLALCSLLSAQAPAPQVIAPQVTATDPANQMYVAGPGWVEKLAANHETVVWKTGFDPAVAAVAVDSVGNVYAAGASGAGGFSPCFRGKESCSRTPRSITRSRP